MSEAADQIVAIARQQAEANPDLARRLESLAVVVKTGGTDPALAMFDRLVAASERESKALEREAKALEREEKLVGLAQRADARDARMIGLLKSIRDRLPAPGSRDNRETPSDTEETQEAPSTEVAPSPPDAPALPQPSPETSAGALAIPARTFIQQLGDLPVMLQGAFVLLCLAVLALVVGLVGVTVTHGDTVVSSGATAEKVNEARLESAPDPDIELDDADGGGDAIDLDTMDTGFPLGPVPQP